MTMSFEEEVAKITGPCRCHEGFTSRKRKDPDCDFCQLGEEIAAALREAFALGLEAGAEIAERDMSALGTTVKNRRAYAHTRIADRCRARAAEYRAGKEAL